MRITGLMLIKHCMNKIIKIETEEDYRKGLLRFVELCESEKTDEDMKELILLTNLMEKYERSNCSEN